MENEMITCDSCQLVRIQGLICHESGCIDSWIDPATGEGYVKECKWCGSDFVPETKWQIVCDESCGECYFG